MKLKDIKQWIETLPEEFLEFDVMNAEEGPMSDGEMYYRKDIPIVSLNVDENSKEILFLTYIIRTEEEKEFEVELKARTDACDECDTMANYEDPDKWSDVKICPKCGQSTDILKKSWEE